MGIAFTMKEMNDTIMAHRSEVAEVRLALTDLSKRHVGVTSSAGCNQWSKVVGKHVRNHQANPSKSVIVQLSNTIQHLGQEHLVHLQFCHLKIGLEILT